MAGLDDIMQRLHRLFDLRINVCPPTVPRDHTGVSLSKRCG
jgi:hypothetical protein